MAPDAIEIHPGTPNTYFEQKEVKGQETAPFFADANNVVAEGSYYTQRPPHLPIEPDVGYGYMNEEGKLVIHSKSIGLHLHGLMIAPGLGLDFGNDMVMVQCNAGGTFGYKFSPTMEALIGVAVLATGRPCHLRYNYEQQQQYTGKRSPFFTTVRYAADKATGKIKAMEADWIVDHGPYSEFGDLLTLRGAQYIGAGYGIENIRGLGKTVCTNHGWGAAFRGYGAPESEFASEVLIDELAEKLGMEWHFSKAIDRDGGEYGATTGRPRRMGWLDLVAARYGCMVQGATAVAFTVLDALGYLDEIPVCVGYELDGKRIDSFPPTAQLKRCKPILEVLPGWKCDIGGIKRYEDLPENARRYVEFAEKEIGVPITMVSNGPAREDIIYR